MVIRLRRRDGARRRDIPIADCERRREPGRGLADCEPGREHGVGLADCERGREHGVGLADCEARVGLGAYEGGSLA